MNEESRGQTEEVLADVRHHLRTPLNHIIGYSDLLLEEPAALDAQSVAILEAIRSSAHVILERIQFLLGPGEQLTPDQKITALKAEIAPTLEKIIDDAGKLAQNLHGGALLDVLRIAVAGRDLQTFLESGAASAPVRPHTRTSELTTVSIPSIPARILVVDDDQTNCEVLQRQLERYGHSVSSVGSGMEALVALNEPEYDLVLLDVMMPGMSGFEVLQRLKSNETMTRIPVIMMSALDELEVAAQCIQMGAEDYLLKPFDPVLLRARIHSALERRRLHQSAQERTEALEKATESLARANENLSRFAFAASHDLQEPLRNITTTLQLLARQFGHDLPPEQNELLTLAVDGARRMSDLIRDLLAYSVATSRERDVGSVDTEAVLSDSLSNLRQAIEESQATVTHEPLPAVIFDQALLRQLFQNLIGNAIKYRSERPPEVHLNAQREGDRWLFAVRDNGMGIEDQYRHTIFEPFRRLHGRGLPGTGLGLAICARIVEGSGGRIWVESEPGKGSTFYFTVLCHATASGADEAPGAPEVANATLKAAR